MSTLPVKERGPTLAYMSTVNASGMQLSASLQRRNGATLASSKVESVKAKLCRRLGFHLDLSQHLIEAGSRRRRRWRGSGLRCIQIWSRTRRSTVDRRRHLHVHDRRHSSKPHSSPRLMDAVGLLERAQLFRLTELVGRNETQRKHVTSCRSSLSVSIGAPAAAAKRTVFTHSAQHPSHMEYELREESPLVSADSPWPEREIQSPAHIEFDTSWNGNSAFESLQRFAPKL